MRPERSSRWSHATEICQITPLGGRPLRIAPADAMSAMYSASGVLIKVARRPTPGCADRRKGRYVCVGKSKYSSGPVLNHTADLAGRKNIQFVGAFRCAGDGIRKAIVNEIHPAVLRIENDTGGIAVLRKRWSQRDSRWEQPRSTLRSPSSARSAGRFRWSIR